MVTHIGMKLSTHTYYGIILHSIPAKKGTEERIERYLCPPPPPPTHPPFPNAKDTLTKHMTHTHYNTRAGLRVCHPHDTQMVSMATTNNKQPQEVFFKITSSLLKLANYGTRGDETLCACVFHCFHGQQKMPSGHFSL